MSFLESLSPFSNPAFGEKPPNDFDAAGFFLFHDQKLLFPSEEPRALDFNELPSNIEPTELIYVGRVDSRPYYTISLGENPFSIEPVSLRSLLDHSQPFFHLAGRAMQLVQWDQTHRFCGRCGSGTALDDKELVRICGGCGLNARPRLSPCVIMLVHRGDEIALAQRPGGPEFYTVQAGFIEPGESAEQAVTREVMEETGLELSSLTYYGSQPWPFPGQLMLGYIAESLSGELIPDPTELKNAGWFDYRNLPAYPGPHTISGKLIRHFVATRNTQAD